MFKVKNAWFIALFILFTLFILTSCSDPGPAGPPLEGDVSDLASEFINSLVGQKYDRAYDFFNTEMRKAMSERQLRQTWERTLAQLGAYKGEVEKTIDEVEEYTAINVITDFENDRINIRVVFDQDKRVAGLWFHPAE